MNLAWSPRRVLGAILVMALVMTAVLAAEPASDSSDAPEEGPALQSADRPNVLIVVTDDQREDTMGVMRDTQDFFDAGGVRFDNGYVTTPLCCPSRASIFTGRFVHNHDVLDTTSAERLDHGTTLQAYLQEAGYNTAISGKFLNLWNIHSDPAYFDRWAIFNDEFGPDGYRNEQWNVNGKVRNIRGYTTTVVGDKAIRFIEDFEAQDERPWVLFVFPFAPHAPYIPQAKYADAPVPVWDKDPSMRERNLSDKPGWVRKRQSTMREVRKARTGQLRTLMSVDDMMARLIGRTDALEETSETMVFYTSDNGYLWGEHGLLQKRYPYGPSVRVPFFLRYDAVDLSSIDTDALVANIDIAPTVLEAAGVPQDSAPPMDGQSLLSAPSRSRMHLEFFAEFGVPSWASTVTEDTQYIEYYGKNGTTITFKELYRLAADPWQLRNVLKDGKSSNDPSGGSLRAMHRQLAQDRECRGATCP